MTELVINMAIGLSIAGLFSDVIIPNLFKLDDMIRENRLKNRIESARKLPKMTKERARVLLGIKG